MKVVLIKDVKGLGSKGDAIEQKDGYALNFLIPQGLAVSEKSYIAKNAIQKKGEVADRKEIQHELLGDIIKSLDGEVFSFSKKVNDKGGLYEKVDVKEIISKISEVKNAELPEDSITLKAPFDAVGEYSVAVSNDKVSATITVSIVEEVS